MTLAEGSVVCFVKAGVLPRSMVNNSLVHGVVLGNI